MVLPGDLPIQIAEPPWEPACFNRCYTLFVYLSKGFVDQVMAPDDPGDAATESDGWAPPDLRRVSRF